MIRFIHPHRRRTIEEAIAFIESYEEGIASGSFVKYELNVRYSNGNEIRGQFGAKSGAVEFLRRLLK